MVSRMVNRYVERVVDRLPFWVKSSARKDLKDTIYSMLQDYCEGEIPVGRDLRAVLQELGSPEDLADQYYEYRKALRKRRKVSVRKILGIVQAILLTAAFILVMAGLVLLMTGMTNNLTMMVIGGAMAVVVMVTRMFMPMPDVNLTPERRNRRAREAYRAR